jgi:hypothetical protein
MRNCGRFPVASHNRYATLAEAEAKAELLHTMMRTYGATFAVRVVGYIDGEEKDRGVCIRAEDRGEPVQWRLRINDKEI